MNGIYGDKVALVTGGGSGIGRAAVEAFARAGAKVIVADRSEKGGMETVTLIKGLGGDANFFRVDVSKEDEVEKMVNHAVSTYGRLDFAFNNAGIGTFHTPIAELSEDKWNLVVNVDLKGVFLCMKHELRVMLRQGKGSIVNNSSGAGLFGYPGIADYVAAKHGVVGLTKSAALEYAKQGIRINAVCPGTIETPLIASVLSEHPEKHAEYSANVPMGHLGQPQNVADAVIWLCSEKASFITGVALPVDGGLAAGG